MKNTLGFGGRVQTANRPLSILLLVVLAGCGLILLGCEPEPEPEPYTTKFEGAWVKENRKFIFTGDRWVYQTKSGSEPFENLETGIFKYDDKFIRFDTESIWDSTNSVWRPIQLNFLLQHLFVADYVFNGNKLNLSNTNYANGSITSYNGDWVKQ
jgi:hypothetical protein